MWQRIKVIIQCSTLCWVSNGKLNLISQKSNWKASIIKCNFVQTETIRIKIIRVVFDMEENSICIEKKRIIYWVINFAGCCTMKICIVK